MSTRSWFAALVSQKPANSQADPAINDSETRPRVVILAGAGSYRCAAFKAAAARLGIDVIEAADVPDVLEAFWDGPLVVDYLNVDAAANQVAQAAIASRASAILALDDSATLVASLASEQARLPHNAPEASLAARDKLVMRRKLRDHGAPTPWFEAFPMTASAGMVSSSVHYPCVVKPTRLSGSRGVIRANDAAELDEAFARVVRILQNEGADPDRTEIIVEQYLPGAEVAVEGILTNGTLLVLSIFDKPDPLEGPFFEETIYVTPSRHSEQIQQRIEFRTAEGATALGIQHGPVHAELRVGEHDAWVIEIAGRSIGGLCSTILEFGSGQSLEDLILMNAIGRELQATTLTAPALGVMMIPIPRGGVLKSVTGIENALAVEGITDLKITAQLNGPIDALPEGSAYLGFIFARGESPEQVERALRGAHQLLEVRIDPLLSMARVS
ncbi:ATP-grasp domain-containing protein [soil metagenome]